jgi:hypothetical protein
MGEWWHNSTILYFGTIWRSALNIASMKNAVFWEEETFSSETSVYNKLTRRHIPEDGILHSHRRENLKSYIVHMNYA